MPVWVQSLGIQELQQLSEALSNQSKTGHIRTIVNQMTPFIKEVSALKVYKALKTLN